MKHRIGFNRLGRKPAHRKALHRNMVTSLFKHERIRTTKAKAQAIRRTAEKMITRAKVDSVHNRRMIARDIKDKAILAKLFTELGPRFKERPGGYTRILKIGYRPGDAAPMVLLELVGEMKESRSGSKAASAKKTGGAKPAKARDAGKATEKPAKPAKQKAEKAVPAEAETAVSAAGTEADAEAGAAPESTAEEPEAEATDGEESPAEEPVAAETSADVVDDGVPEEEEEAPEEEK